MATNGSEETSTREANDTALKNGNDEPDHFDPLALSLTDAIQHDIHVDLLDIHPVPQRLVERGPLFTAAMVVDLEVLLDPDDE